MGDIKQLPPEVADQISAGEVIERPASVVKELVENSIDAGSNNILIEIDKGGKDRIRVKDNGSGIRGEDLDLAFSRYATSKINDINDLYSLRTLGFRGEALASIASVSRVKVISRYNNEISGNKLIIEGSKIKKKSKTGCPQGTDITITDLFFNTPARFKYMKTTNTEFGHISRIVNNEALANPEIMFTLKHNNRQLLKTPGSGKLRETIFSIYGRELTNKLLPVNFEDKYIQVKGYIARPSFYRSSRIYEMFFVNKRVVQNNILCRSLEEAYKGLLPPRSYPAAFLFIKLNPILVDVNVHPTKREIKFSRNQIIREVIRSGIKKTLTKIDPSRKFNINNNENTKKNRTNSTKPGKNNISQKRNNSSENKINNIREKNNNKYREKKSENKSSKEPPLKSSDKTEKNRDKIIKSKNNDHNPINKILGQIHNTYIIIEINDGLYIIDQHAAHERILYDRLCEKYNNKEVVTQPLLVPVNIEVTLPEMEIINNYTSELKKIGIKLENFGSKSFIIREIPIIIKKRSSKNVIREIIDNLLAEGKTMKQAEMVNELLTIISCRSAVKAGDRLDNNEIKKISNDLFSTNNPYRCPHGRPTILHLSKKELDKELGRT